MSLGQSGDNLSFPCSGSGLCKRCPCERSVFGFGSLFSERNCGFGSQSEPSDSSRSKSSRSL